MIAAAEVRLVAGNTEANITSGCSFHRLIGRLTVDGLALFCKGCRADHVISWAELDRVRISLAPDEGMCYPSR